MNTKSNTTTASQHTHPTWLTGRIVVGVDGSQHSAEALRHAEQLALFGGARIEVIVAWDLPKPLGPVMGPITWSPGDEAQTRLDETLGTVFGDEVPDNVTATTRRGGAAAVLIEASEGADLLVVGGRGHGALASALLGSVSSVCAERAHCPVLVIHETD